MKKQLRIPGTEQPVNKEVRTAAQEYMDLDEAAGVAAKAKVAARDKLIFLMGKHGLKSYVEEEANIVVVLDSVERVTVKPYLSE